MTLNNTYVAACVAALTISGPIFAQEAGWQFNAQGLALQRSGISVVPLVVDGGGGPTTYLSADEFNGDWNGGLKFSASRDINDQNGLVLDGFFTQSVGATRTVSTAGAEFLVYGATFGAPTFNIDYNSSLSGAGATWTSRSKNGKVKWLGGLRAMRLGETLTVTDAASPPNLLFGDLSNNMLGVQAGVETTALKTNAWEIAGGVRLGAYSNMASFDAAFPQAGAAAIFNSKGRTLATSAELWVGVDYRINKNTSLNFGYQALLLNKVGLLPEQLDDLAVPILGQMDMGGTPLYQGITLGIQANW